MAPAAATAVRSDDAGRPGEARVGPARQLGHGVLHPVELAVVLGARHLQASAQLAERRDREGAGRAAGKAAPAG